MRTVSIHIPLGPYFCDINTLMYMRLVAKGMGDLYHGGNWTIGKGRAVIQKDMSHVSARG
jgi:hypothetical protein